MCSAAMTLAVYAHVLAGQQEAATRVPLGYDFRLYTYGPYDATVLDDLEYAQQLGAVSSEIDIYSKGYGYSYSPGRTLEAIQKRSTVFLATYDDALDQVVSAFASKSASQLELESTLFFVARNNDAHNRKSDLVEQVKEIKPHFPVDQIRSTADALARAGHLPTWNQN